MASQFVRKITDTTTSEPIKETTTSGDLIITKDDKVLINLNGTLKYLTAGKIGGRNYILNSKRTLSGSGSSNVQDTEWVYTSIPVSAFSNKTFTISVQVDYDNITAVTGFGRIGVELTNNSVLPDGSSKTAYVGAWRKPVVGESFHGRVYATLDMSEVTFKNVYTENQWANGLYIQGITGTNISVSNPKLEMGNVATDWTPAPEDIQSDIVTANTAIKKNADDIKAANTNIKKNTDDITQLKADIEALKSAE